MEVSSTILKKIVKECCRSLSYDDEERQFSFRLKPSLAMIWEKMKDSIQVEYPDFFIADFNNVLSHIDNLKNMYSKRSIYEMEDRDIMVGEIIEISVAESISPILMVKMKAGQYLRIDDGVALSLGTEISFAKGKEIFTSEGIKIGECRGINICIPSKNSVALSGAFLKKYYKNKVSDSLWSIYEMGKRIVNSSCSRGCEEILTQATASGINALTLMCILKAVVES